MATEKQTRPKNPPARLIRHPVPSAPVQEPSEPTTKATFDLPRSLHQQLKIRAATEGRPARAILIDLLTRYLQEEAL